MSTIRHATRLRVAALALGTLSIAGCGESASTAPHETLHANRASSPAGASPTLTKAVHAATARFHATVQATKAGYAEASECVAVPGLGGMGFHWVKQSLVDPVFDPLQPEAVLYEPDAKGNLKLVAVEYIVIDVGQPAPTFGGQPFDVGGTPVPVAHWSLHVWVHKDNPNGIFTPFNPAVTCPAA